jgi:hypothetical protein
MEVERVEESNGAQASTDRRTSKKDRRIFWAGVFILGTHKMFLLLRHVCSSPQPSG